MSEEVLTEHPRYVSFSVQGEFITALAREKLFVEKDLAAALRLLRPSLMSDQLDSDEQLMLCLQILHGAAEITGNSGAGDYGVEFRDDLDENPTNLSAISNLISDLNEEVKRLRTENRNLMLKMNFLAHELSDYRLERVNSEYYNEMGEPLFADMPIPAWRMNESPINPEGSDMLESYLAQRRREQEAAINEEPVCDYGWLEPDGTWHPVEWGLHSKWAGEYLKEHYPFKDFAHLYWHVHDDGSRHYINGGDVLMYSLGWVLLDSPHQGLAKPKSDPRRNYTKAQKEFLYDYFIERDRNDEANALYAED